MTHVERIAYLNDQPGETISPTELSKIIGGRAYTYNLAAREGRLQLPHVWRGRNLRIFKAPVLRILQGGMENVPIDTGSTDH